MLVKNLNKLVFIFFFIFFNQGCIGGNQHGMDRYDKEKKSNKEYVLSYEKKQQRELLSKELEKEKARSYMLDIEEEKFSNLPRNSRGHSQFRDLSSGSQKAFAKNYQRRINIDGLSTDERDEIRKKQTEEAFDRHCKRNQWRRNKINNKK